MPDLTRFWSKVDKSGDCWLWTAGQNGYGYGGYWNGRKKVGAHRFSYELVHGPIASDQLLDHLCGVRACVKPDHLVIATAKENGEHHATIHPLNTSGFRGVTFWKRDGTWKAQVHHWGRNYHVGYFETPEEAAEAARAKRLELYSHTPEDRRVSNG